MTKIEDRINRLIVKYSDSIGRSEDNKKFAIKNNLSQRAIDGDNARIEVYKIMLKELIELKKISKEC